MSILRAAIPACIRACITAIIASHLPAAEGERPAAAEASAPPSDPAPVARSYGWREDGVGSFPTAHPPATWSATENVAWLAKSTPSAASPVVSGSQVFCTAEPTVLLALDRATGALQWKADASIVNATPPYQRMEVHQRRKQAQPIQARMAKAQGMIWKAYAAVQAKPDDAAAKALLKEGQDAYAAAEKDYQPFLDVVDPPVHSFGYAYSTPVTDGVHVWDLFYDGVAVCADTAGKVVWMRRLEIPAPRDAVGGAPLLVDGKLILCYFGLRALDPATGEQLWKTEQQPSWGTPVPVMLGQARALLTASGDLVRVQDGHRIGNLFPANFHSSPIVHDGVAYAIERDAVAIKLPESDADHPKPQVLWRIPQLNEPDDADNRADSSPLFDNGIVYACSCGGRLTAIAADSGKILYQHDLDGPKGDQFITSVTRGGSHLYVGGSSGRLHAFDPGPEYHEVGCNSLGGGWSFGNPVFIGDRVYLHDQLGIYCIAAGTAAAATASPAATPAR